MSRKPPTDRDHLALFLDVVEHDDRLRAALPSTADDRNVSKLDDIDLPPSLELRLMLLRKYVVKKENLYLPTVLDVIGRLPDLPGSINDFLNTVRTRFDETTAGKLSFGIVGHDESIHLEFFWDAIYGTLMHADYDKWAATRKHRNFVRNWSLLELEDQYWKLIISTHATLIDGINTGHLADPRTH